MEIAESSRFWIEQTIKVAEEHAVRIVFVAKVG
jgi:hypothetical protein